MCGDRDGSDVEGSTPFRNIEDARLADSGGNAKWKPGQGHDWSSGTDTHRFRSNAFPVAGSPPLTADLMIPVPQGLEPESYDQKTGGEDNQFSVTRDKNAVSDENNVSRLSGQDSTHRLGRSSIGGDQIQPSAPRWTEPTETTALLGQENTSRRAAVFKQWDNHLAEGKLETTWKHEFLVLIRNASPLVITCLLQYTLTGASVLAVGHLGRNELGAVSLAGMTSNITGYVIYEGLSTGLDTLCAQAYGSGKLHLVGLNLQRMTYFLWFATIPIAAIWLSSTQLLLLVIPEKECARLAGLYLKVLLLGVRGGEKRFNWGFIGAPIAVAITHNLLAFCLFLYVYFVNGSQCWPGFSKQALQNWGPMVKLGGSGFLMVIAEFLAFEILTLASSYLSGTTLAAQAALASLSIVTFQIPFPISIAGSTRLANLIGAGLPGAAKICIQVTLMIGFAAGLLNMVLLTALRNSIPKLFTDDMEVRAIIVTVLPIFAAFQLFDAGVANVNGIMRGMGRQVLGSWVNMCCYYLIAIPISLSLAFGLGWGLFGLWMGPPTGLFLVTTIEGWFIYNTNWDFIIEAAARRNESA